MWGAMARWGPHLMGMRFLLAGKIRPPHMHTNKGLKFMTRTLSGQAAVRALLAKALAPRLLVGLLCLPGVCGTRIPIEHTKTTCWRSAAQNKEGITWDCIWTA